MPGCDIECSISNTRHNGSVGTRGDVTEEGGARRVEWHFLKFELGTVRVVLGTMWSGEDQGLLEGRIIPSPACAETPSSPR